MSGLEDKNNQKDTPVQKDTGQESVKKTSGILDFIRNRPVLTAIIAGLLVVVVVYFWKDMQGRRDTAKVINLAHEQVTTRQQELLQIMAKPLVWSIRAEMLRGNLEQVNILVSDMVKEKNFRYIHLVEPDGKILLSTNKRLEGQSLKGEVDAVLLSTESPVVRRNNEKQLVVAAPVMGVDRRLATLVFCYQPESFKY
jgi:hypothetical protein